MSTSTAALGLAPGKFRKSSRRPVLHNLLGTAAITCLIAGCGWTVYSNILAASIYPTLGGADYDAVMKPQPQPQLASRTATQAVNEAFAALPQQVAIEKPEPISETMFNERFAASARQGVASNAASVALAETTKVPEAPKADTSPAVAAPKVADSSKLAEAPRAKQPPAQVALNVPPPQVAAEPKAAKGTGISIHDMAERAKQAVMSITSREKQSIVEKLWGKQPAQGPLLAFASADASITGSIGQNQNPTLGGSPPYDRSTAVYDISAHTVYLPDGTRLEAHSGLGSNLDDPHSARVRMRGVTPPHIYELKPREALFHGVPALRLNPIGGEDAIFGRNGLLAHTYMLGPNGDSNGCVSFRDYNAFLDAYHNKGIKKLAVLARID